MTPLTIGGAASDDGTVTNVTWSNSRGGSGTCTGTDSWSADVPLFSGTNVITITAQDDQGNRATDTLTVTYSSSAPGMPTVTFTAPTSRAGYIATASPLTIGGSADDDGSVASVTWSNDRGGSGTCTGTESWSADVALFSGRNVITVTVQDDEGNSATDMLIVSYSDSSDGDGRQGGDNEGDSGCMITTLMLP
jgi:hypothetical protein